MSVFSVDNVPDHVLEMCTAYEQGFGKGQELRKCINPYGALTDDWWAWGYGYSEGSRKRTKS